MKSFIFAAMLCLFALSGHAQDGPKAPTDVPFDLPDIDNGDKGRGGTDLRLTVDPSDTETEGDGKYVLGGAWGLAEAIKLEHCAATELPGFINALELFQRKLSDDVSIGHAQFVKQTDIRQPRSLLGQGYDYVYTQYLLTLPGVLSTTYLLVSDIHFTSTPLQDDESALAYFARMLGSVFFPFGVIHTQSSLLNTSAQCQVRSEVRRSPDSGVWQIDVRPAYRLMVGVTVDHLVPAGNTSAQRRHDAERTIAAALRELAPQ